MHKTIHCLLMLAAIWLVPSLAVAQLPPPAPVVQPFSDGAHWMLAAPFTYQIGNTNLAITVPAGFVTDFASIPRVFHALLAPTGRPGRGAIVHDYLYWEQSCTREQADWILMLAMMESRVDAVTRRLVYTMVDWLGGDAWELNRRERASGLPRVIPAAFMALPALADWPVYRQELFQKKVPIVPTAASVPNYCAGAMAITDPNR